MTRLSDESPEQAAQEPTQDAVLRAVYALRPDVRFRRVAEEAVVLAQDQGEVLVLNEVGARVLELIDGRKAAEEWLPGLLVEYGVEEAALRSDVARYLGELLDGGVIATVV